MRKLAAAEIDRLRAEIGRLDNLEQRVECTSRMLTEMTQSMSITAAIPSQRPALDHVELVSLPGGRVLMVVMTRDQQVNNRVVTLDEPSSPEELASIRNYINRNFAGWMLEDVRRGAGATAGSSWTAATYDAILKKLTVLYAKGLLDLGAGPEVHIEGASNLFAVDLHLTKEKTRELFRALEEKKRILELLDRFLEHPSGELAVHVGLAEIHPSMRELSLIGVPVMLPGGMSAVIAVLGPMRMNYRGVISAVQHMGQAFQRA